MRLAVIGTGYVGLVAGAAFADVGHEVTCADIDGAKIALLSAGALPIHEPGLDVVIARNLQKGKLRFTTELPRAIAGAKAVFIAVGTPAKKSGAADVSMVLDAARTIGESIHDFTVVAVKSTVPVGTCDEVARILERTTTHPFAVVSNPEFLKEGDALADFLKPSRVIVGADDERARALMKLLYAPFLRTNDRLHFMSARSAELTKYGSNAFLAVRISFMNELANLCEHLGADVDEVRRGLGADPRIGPRFLFPGAGYGGSCFPKDLSALLHCAGERATPLEVVSAAERANRRQRLILASKIERHFDAAGQSLAGRTLALWGLAFKPGTDDLREAPAVQLIERLLAEGARVIAHDPVAMENARGLFGDRVRLAPEMYQAVEAADGLVLLTEWHDFRRPDFQRIRGLMRTPVVFDGRNLWEPGELRGLGFTYYGIGRG